MPFIYEFPVFEVHIECWMPFSLIFSDSLGIIYINFAQKNLLPQKNRHQDDWTWGFINEIRFSIRSTFETIWGEYKRISWRMKTGNCISWPLFFWWVWDLSLGLSWKSGTPPLKPHLQSILLRSFWRWGLLTICQGWIWYF
jgi:hypothetical protein